MKQGRAMLEFLLDPRRDIELFGMYGAYNLGDEAMRVAGLASLPLERTVAWMGSGKAWLNHMLRRRKRRELVFGGGTLIHGGKPNGENGWLEYAELKTGRGAGLSFLGTGISFRGEQLAEQSNNVVRWQHLLGQARHVGVRGPLSQSVAARLGIEASIFGDAAFLLHDRALAASWRPAARAGEGVLGINIGGVMENDQARYETIFASLLARLAPTWRLRVFVVTPPDIAATERVLAASGIMPDRYEIIHNYVDPISFMRRAIQCAGFIGIRLHAAGLAMVAGVPSLLIEYKPKCRDFVLPIGMEHALIELPLDPATLDVKVDDLLARPEFYRAVSRIEALSEAQRATTAALFA